MDLFTHIIISYLVSFGITLGHNPTYIAAGALAGGLPDSDILLMPLTKRFPLLRHHGITHSILGVTGIALAGALIGPYFSPGAVPLLLFLFMEVGGLLHIFLDGFTHFSVPPFAPFSKVELHLDADRAVNLGTLGVSLASFFILVDERNNVPFMTWIITGWVLLAVYAGYLVMRGVSRWLSERARILGGYTAVVPTGNPFNWFLVDEKEDSQSWRMRLAVYKVGRGIVSRQKDLSICRSDNLRGPILNSREAMERSYLTAMGRSRFLASSYRYAHVTNEGEWYDVIWFSLEYLFIGRAPGIHARVNAKTGLVETKRAWFNVTQWNSIPSSP